MTFHLTSVWIPLFNFPYILTYKTEMKCNRVKFNELLTNNYMAYSLKNTKDELINGVLYNHSLIIWSLAISL